MPYWTALFARCALVLSTALLLASPARAQLADTILINGKIITLDPVMPVAEAIAIRDGRIMAVGLSDMITAMTDGRTRVLNLGGRTVIPGLIDSHIHAIRAGLTFTTEVHWIGARTLDEALGRLRSAAQTMPKGSWLVVAGGWTERQFAEGRRPTQAEVAAAAPDHHVYVQLLYSAMLLSPGGIDEICQFISPAKGDAMHFSGSHRCEYMRQCFSEFGIR